MRADSHLHLATRYPCKYSLPLAVSARVKIPTICLAALVLVIAICWAAGLVEFSYVHVVPNEPLHQPRKVQRLDGTNMVIEGGEIIGLRPKYSSERSDHEILSDISNLVSRSDFQVDVEQRGGGTLEVFVRRPSKFRDCLPPVTLPLIRETVPRYRREAVAFGVFISTNGATRSLEK